MEIMQSGVKVLGKYFLCVILCFFTFFSFTAIFSMMDNTKDAYSAYVYEVDGENKKEITAYNHVYADGKDELKPKYEAQGYKVETYEYNILSGAPFVTCLTVAQIVSLIFFVVMVPREVQKIGARDANRVARGEVVEDKLKGVKIGSVVSAFSLFSYICLILFKTEILSKMGLFIYQYFNYYSFGYQTLIFGGDPKAFVFSTTAMVLAFLPVLLPMIVCGIAYILGYKDINLYQKTVYQNKKEEI